MQSLLQKITDPCLRKDLPNLKPGKKVEVITKVTDKKDPNKHKFSSFKGIIIAVRKKNQINCTFTVIKESSKVIVKIVYFYHSPLISAIKEVGKMPVRRAKLFYLERALAKKKANE